MDRRWWKTVAAYWAFVGLLLVAALVLGGCSFDDPEDKPVDPSLIACPGQIVCLEGACHCTGVTVSQPDASEGGW
jgi:hypothetical protein